MLPVSQIVPIVTLMNDRYLYFPLLGAAACFGSLACRVHAFSGLRRVILLVATGLVMVSLPLLSFARAGVWKNELTLWRDASNKAPNHQVALYGLAQALQNSGALDAALPVYLRVLELNPGHLDTLTHLGALYRSKNLPLEGRSYLLDITRFYPAYAKGFVDLGLNYYQTDDLDEAEKAFRRAQELQPRSKEALRYLGMIALKTKRVAAARDYFLKLVSLGGTSADVAYNLACVEALGGNPGQALKHLETAFRLGFHDRESIENDGDLAAIRPLPEFPVCWCVRIWE